MILCHGRQPLKEPGADCTERAEFMVQMTREGRTGIPVLACLVHLNLLLAAPVGSDPRVTFSLTPVQQPATQ